jgi:phage FluMu protein Com
MNNKNKRVETQSEFSCPKCNQLMKRIKRVYSRTDAGWYTEWDKCWRCKHIQHYKEYYREPTRFEMKLVGDDSEEKPLF